MRPARWPTPEPDGAWPGATTTATATRTSITSSRAGRTSCSATTAARSWTSARPLDDAGAGAGAVWGDYDGDGDPDLYLVNQATANKLFRNDGGGFVDVTFGALGDTGTGTSAAWVDFDSDGKLDLYVGNHGANVLLQGDGAGGFVDASAGPLADAGNCNGVAWGDYDGDGDEDLYLANDGQANRLLRNDGGGVFVDVAAGGMADAGAGVGAAWGDFDNDEDLDLYLTNGGANRLMQNDGGGSFSEVVNPVVANADSGAGVVWADLDLDGDLDLYLSNRLAPDRFLRNDGGGGFVDATGGTVLGDAGAGQAVAAADIDADGDVDLYVSVDGGPNRLYRNQSTTAHWLQIDVEGVQSNRDGLGARIRVVSGGNVQTRQVTAGSGFESQDAHVAAFGLGAATVADTVHVLWPSGATLDTTAVAADQILVLVEPATGLPVPESSFLPIAFALRQSAPNPFRSTTRIAYDLPQPSGVSIRVYDVQGRLVRELVRTDNHEPGRHTVVWDGRDGSGMRVASGMYLYRIDAGSFRKIRKMMVLR
ncbi:FG-GAP-like repeat-containing protein [bacterium]|nr:FG-GAP-like repeat-containing protein [bacterium]